MTDPSSRLQLQPVRPRRADLVARGAGLARAGPGDRAGGRRAGDRRRRRDRARRPTPPASAPGTPVVAGGADTQLGLVGIGVVDPDRVTLVGGSFWQTTIVTDHPLIDPQARVRTLCHAVDGQWMTEGIGFYCGIVMRWYRDAFCELEKAEAERRGDRRLRPSWRRPRRASRRAPTASSASSPTSWTPSAGCRRRPSFLQFDVDDPAGSGRVACIRAIEEQAAYASRGHLAIIEELTGRTYDEIVFTGGAAKGRLWPQIVADVLGRGGEGPGGQGIDRPRRRDLRRPRRRAVRRPRGGRGPDRPLRADRGAGARRPGRLRRAATRAGPRSTRASSSFRRKASSAPCGGRPAPDRAADHRPDRSQPEGSTRDARGRCQRDQAVPPRRARSRASTSS